MCSITVSDDFTGDSEQTVLLYIDNSNVFESAKKHSGQVKGFLSGIPDVTCRIDIGKLMGNAVGKNRRMLLAKLYGSEPPALDLDNLTKYINNCEQIVLIPCVKELYTQIASASSSCEQQHTRKYNFYKDIQPYMHQLQEHFTDICSDVTTWYQFINGQRETDEFKIVSTNRFMQLINNNGDDDEQEDIDTRPEIDFEEFDSDDFIDGQYEFIDYDNDEDFVPVIGKGAKLKSQLYSDACEHKFWCAKGSKCAYKHTEREQEFFKLHTDFKVRRFYKIKFCIHHGENRCKFKDRPYLCPYAHKLEESRCLCCRGKENGNHWMDQCPRNTQVTQNKN